MGLFSSKNLTALATGGASLLFPSGGGGGGGPDYARILEAQKKTEEGLSPYTTGGSAAQTRMMGLMGLGGADASFDPTTIPGYQQAMKTGLGAVNQGAAGSGMLMSGDRLKALQSTGENIFGNYYQNYLGQLQGMSQQGMQGQEFLGQQRMGGANAITNMMEQQRQQKAQQKAGMFGDVLGLAGTVGGFMMGGPMGAAAGGQIGSGLGSSMGGGSSQFGMTPTSAAPSGGQFYGF